MKPLRVCFSLKLSWTNKIIPRYLSFLQNSTAKAMSEAMQKVHGMEYLSGAAAEVLCK